MLPAGCDHTPDQTRNSVASCCAPHPSHLSTKRYSLRTFCKPTVHRTKQGEKHKRDSALLHFFSVALHREIGMANHISPSPCILFPCPASTPQGLGMAATGRPSSLSFSKRIQGQGSLPVQKARVLPANTISGSGYSRGLATYEIY